MKLDRKLSIFISSTFLDLKEARAAVIQAVLRVGHSPVAIETLGATPRPAQDVLRETLGRSDAVVMLVGHRYGTTDPETGKGWLEREYEFAKSINVPVVAFLLAEDAAWPASLVDEDRRPIQRFRQRLAAETTVHLFHSSQDLLAAATNVLIELVRGLLTNEPEPERLIGRCEVRVVRMLLSSPGDVAEERERAEKAVFRFNQLSVEEKGLFVRVVRWEDMAPQIGPSPQQVINSQIGDYHLFCGIMWNRFGTPTEIAASGTKEEFDGALSSWKARRKPWVTFYFCDRAVKFTTREQVEQKAMVIDFRATLTDKGIVRSFEETREFEEILYGDLRRITELTEFRQMLD